MRTPSLRIMAWQRRARTSARLASHLGPAQCGGNGGCGRAGVGRAGDRAADHQQVRSDPQRLLRGRDPRLIVHRGTGRPHSGVISRTSRPPRRGPRPPPAASRPARGPRTRPRARPAAVTASLTGPASPIRPRSASLSDVSTVTADDPGAGRRLRRCPDRGRPGGRVHRQQRRPQPRDGPRGAGHRRGDVVQFQVQEDLHATGAAHRRDRVRAVPQVQLKPHLHAC